MSDGPLPCTVDANVVLRYLLRDDEALWRKADAIWGAVEDGRLLAVLDPVVLGEIVFVMSKTYGLSNEEISDALTTLIRPDHVTLFGKDRYLRALRLFAHSVSHFGDACACACALEECEGRLYSFDRKLSAVDGIERREELDA